MGYTVEFMDYVIKQSSINKKEDEKNANGDKMEEMDVVEEMKNDQWLPPICKSNLLILFQRYDNDNNGYLDQNELLLWMTEIMIVNESNSDLHPTSDLCDYLIQLHGTTEGTLEYNNLESWIMDGITLSPEEMISYSKKGKNEKLIVQFLKQIAKVATYEAGSEQEVIDNQKTNQPTNQTNNPKKKNKTSTKNKKGIKKKNKKKNKKRKKKKKKKKS